MVIFWDLASFGILKFFFFFQSEEEILNDEVN